MKKCNGCKHLFGYADLCNALAQPAQRIVNPVTGRVRWEIRGPDGSVFAPTAEEMRAYENKCGADRKLYEPGILARLFPWAYE